MTWTPAELKAVTAPADVAFQTWQDEQWLLEGWEEELYNARQVGDTARIAEALQAIKTQAARVREARREYWRIQREVDRTMLAEEATR